MKKVFGVIWIGVNISNNSERAQEMKTLIITILLIAGAAHAETIIVPLPADTGHKVIQLENRTVSGCKKVEYVWIMVKKTTEELRYERYLRRLEVCRRRQIKRLNRINRGTCYRAYVPPPLKPIVKWKWIKVRKDSQ